MIHQLSEYPFKDKNVFSEKEERFKNNLKAIYGISVRQTLFVEGAASQKHLYIWLDLLHHYEIKQTGVFNLDTNVLCTNDALISCYCEAFAITADPNQQIFVYIFDFKKEIVSFSYGHSIVHIKDFLMKQYPCDRVLLDYADTAIVLQAEFSRCQFLSDKIQSNRKDCLAFLKQFDSYDIIDDNDVRIKIIDKDSSSSEWLNDLYMTNRNI